MVKKKLKVWLRKEIGIKMIKFIWRRFLPIKLKKIIIRAINHVSIINYNKNHCNVGRNSYAIEKEKIRPDTVIGSYCSISANVYIGPGHHPIDYLTTSPFFYNLSFKETYVQQYAQQILNDNSKKKCTIGNDVWIGVNAVIMQGRSIGDGAIVGANAVVTKDIPPYAIVGGSPAKIIKYRFSKEIVNQLMMLRWWDFPDSVINNLPFDDVQLCINKLMQIKQEREKYKICFVITSVIHADNSNLSNSVRSISSVRERMEQTALTISSVREKCINAHIILVEAGAEELSTELRDLADEYVYLGGDVNIRKAVDSKRKGWGEAKMILAVLDRLKDFDFVFKLSGRYYLNNSFSIDSIDFDKYNFKNYTLSGEVAFGFAKKYINGSHSTRLYGIPVRYLKSYETALKKSSNLLRYKGSIEWVLPKRLKGEFYYQKNLGVSGNIAVDGCTIKE